MSSVVPEKRGIASGVNSMLMNTGQMLSIAIGFPLVLSRIPEEVMFRVFLYGGGMSGASLEVFESGMHEAFLAGVAVTLVAAVISALRPGHSNGRKAARVALKALSGFLRADIADRVQGRIAVGSAIRTVVSQS